MKSSKIIALGISLVLFQNSFAQSIGFDAIYQPATSTMVNGVSVIQEPIHGYDFRSISKPHFDFQVSRKTKSNWSYGIGISHNTSAFFSSFNYAIPDGPFTIASELTDYFETRHLGINLFFAKQSGKVSLSQYLGAFNNYDFPSRVPFTTNGFGYDAYISTTLHYEDEELVERISKLAATQYYVPHPNRPMGSQTFTTKIGYQIVENFEIGASILWRASRSTVVNFKNFEEEIRSEENIPVNFIIDEHNRVGNVFVRADKLSWGIFLKYGLSKKLEQKEKKKVTKAREK